MLKLVGLLFLVACGAGVGWQAVQHLRQERSAWELLGQMLRKIAVQMEFRGCTTQELLEQIAEEPAYQRFCFPEQTCFRLAEGIPFPEAWQEALSKDTAVPREAVQHLLPLGEELGASDLEGQLETLAQYARQLEPYAKEAESRCCRLQRLYLSMGILGGLMAAVLLA